MSWLGLDIGGANLKAADSRGCASSIPFALWREPQRLCSALKVLVESGPPVERLAVTMTGELCDCFSSKAEGVRHILTAVEQAATGRMVRVYLVDGRLVTIDVALERTDLAAASNWHALASFACRYTDGNPGLLIDVGSTTTDVIPLVDGRVAAVGTNDTERLLSAELLYRGIGRTPICAVCRTLPLRGQDCPVAAELFATTADAHVLLGNLPDDLEATWTADGRPLTKEHARQRLARQLCADASDLRADDLPRIASQVAEAHLNELLHSIDVVSCRLGVRPSCWIFSGAGEFLGREAVKRLSWSGPQISLAAEIGVSASQCAPAHAVAVLASEGDFFPDFTASTTQIAKISYKNVDPPYGCG